MKIPQLLLFLLFATNIHAQTTRWAKDIGDSSDITWPNAICTDNNNVYLAGFYRTQLTVCDTLPSVFQLTLPQANCNMIISKFDSSGNCKWSVPGIAISNWPPDVPGFSSIKYDGMGNLYATGGFTDTMVFHSDTVRSTSCTHGDCNVAYIVKLDTNGNVLWNKSFGGPSASTQQISYMVLGANGNVYVTGLYQDSIVMDGIVLEGSNPWTYKGFIAEINSSGHCVWIKNVCSAGGLEGMDGITTDGQNIYAMGCFADSLVFPTSTIHQPTYYSSFIAKYDSTGNFIWVYGGSPQITRYLVYGGIKYDDAGHLYVTGEFVDSTTFGSTTMVMPATVGSCIARLDTAGNLDWAFTPGCRAGDDGGNITSPDNTGFYYFTSYQDTAHIGASTYVSAGMDDFLLVRYDTDHSVVWSKSFGGTKHENAVDIVSRNGMIYYAGFTYSTYTVDGFSIVNHNYMDVVLSRIDDPVTFLPLQTSKQARNGANTNIFPNPTTGIINLQSQSAAATIYVLSITGQLLRSQTRNTNFATIDISAFPSGIYLLKDISAAGVATFRVIKE